jgi:hypothetical protein
MYEYQVTDRESGEVVSILTPPSGELPDDMYELADAQGYDIVAIRLDRGVAEGGVVDNGPAAR